MMTKRVQSDRLKKFAIKRVNGGESKASVARSLQIAESTLRGWVKARNAAIQRERDRCAQNNEPYISEDDDDDYSDLKAACQNSSTAGHSNPPAAASRRRSDRANTSSNGLSPPSSGPSMPSTHSSDFAFGLYGLSAGVPPVSTNPDLDSATEALALARLAQLGSSDQPLFNSINDVMTIWEQFRTNASTLTSSYSGQPALPPTTPNKRKSEPRKRTPQSAKFHPYASPTSLPISTNGEIQPTCRASALTNLTATTTPLLNGNLRTPPTFSSPTLAVMQQNFLATIQNIVVSNSRNANNVLSNNGVLSNDSAPFVNNTAAHNNCFNPLPQENHHQEQQQQLSLPKDVVSSTLSSMSSTEQPCDLTMSGPSGTSPRRSSGDLSRLQQSSTSILDMDDEALNRATSTLNAFATTRSNNLYNNNRYTEEELNQKKSLAFQGLVCFIEWATYCIDQSKLDFTDALLIRVTLKKILDLLKRGAPSTTTVSTTSRSTTTPSKSRTSESTTGTAHSSRTRKEYVVRHIPRPDAN